VTESLQALYTFEEGQGDVVHDTSNRGEALNLTIQDSVNTVVWDAERGVLRLTGTTIIKSDERATRLVEAAQQSNELTIEAWIEPAEFAQDGPARIVTLSDSTASRNFTLGQGRWEEAAPQHERATAGFYDIRLRTTDTNVNGTPSLRSGNVLSSTLQHVVYTRQADGTVQFYINGEEQTRQMTSYDGTEEQPAHPAEGTFANWDEHYYLLLANEFTEDRPWRGAYHLVAIYSRALSDEEVQQNFTATANP
jgi:hypothetical protein